MAKNLHTYRKKHILVYKAQCASKMIPTILQQAMLQLKWEN